MVPSQKVLKNNKISILNNKIYIFCDSIMPSQKVKPVTKLIKILKFLNNNIKITISS